MAVEAVTLAIDARQTSSVAPARDTGPAATNAGVAEASSLSEQDVADAARQLQSHLNGAGKSAQFTVDYLSGLAVVTVRDSESGNVIRQIPNAEAVRLARLLGAGEQGPAAGAMILDLTV